MSLPHYEEQRAGEAVGSIWPSRLCSLVEICLKIGSLSAINFSRAESQDFPERLLCVWQRAGARVRWAAKEQVWEGREALCMVHRAIFQEHWLDMAGVTLVESLSNPSAPMVADELHVRDNPLQNVLGVAWSRVDSWGSEQVEREGAACDPSQLLLLCHVWQAAQSKGQGRGVNTADPLQRCL